MILPFYKLHGAGNDFILIDNRLHHIHKYSDNKELIERLCNRHLGIGADGLILLNNKAAFDFEMIYYNSDGQKGSMCGNGGRCVVAFANMLNIVHGKVKFFAHGATYYASILRKRGHTLFVSLQMPDVSVYEENNHFVFLDTGSPHYVCFTDNVANTDVYNDGRKIRNSKMFKEKGVNVNFVEIQKDFLFVRTYERGVENETLSCGTGVTAAAMAAFLNAKGQGISSFNIKTLGGNMKVGFRFDNNIFTEVSLEGPATFVFKGEIEI